MQVRTSGRTVMVQLEDGMKGRGIGKGFKLENIYYYYSLSITTLHLLNYVSEGKGRTAGSAKPTPPTSSHTQYLILSGLINSILYT